ncbi:prevent-host-death protein [Streptomyces tsukubensis]|uniref:prevent-host-death protein n=1 Tax=Streptomyces tsukubensis TaxID=83656 RepID=UPI0036CE19A0
MAAQPEITQHDLRTRSEEIMDAVQNGQSFTVTRDGHRISELIPLRRRRRIVPRSEFAAMSRAAPDICPEAFRADHETTARQEPGIPQVRGPHPRRDHREVRP